MITGYARESTLLNTQDNALEWQVERLKRYGCDRIFIDRMSGASAKRPGYNEMMGLVEAGVITEVVTCSMSRLGRSVIQVQAAIDLFIKKKVKLTALDSSIDLSTAAGRAQVNLQAVFAQLERELIQERVKAGYEGVREQRRAIRAPFGYKLFEGQLRIDPDLEEICRWIRQSAIDVGLIKTTQAINERYPDLPKIPRSPGGIKSWLECETLYGHLCYNRHSPNPTIHRNNHPALFTPQERLEFEASLRFRTRHHGFKADPVRFPFSGLVVCADCGSNMQVSYKHGRENPDIYYRCYKGTRRSCDNRTYTNVKKIQTAVIAALVDRAEAIAIRASQPDDPAAENPKLTELRDQLLLLSRMPANPHIEAAIAGIKADIAVAEAMTVEPITLRPEREKALFVCAKPEFWKEIEPEARHRIYKLLIKEIRCNNREVQSIDLWV